MANFGESWNCLLEAVGGLVVALAARRPWFCCHRLSASAAAVRAAPDRAG